MEQRESGAAAVPVYRSVGGYELLRVLGSGGMGTVYEALDGDGRHVALKLLHPAFSLDDEARERLRREVATLHRVRGAAVAQVLDAEADSAEAFVVTELIDGQSLDESIRQHGPMDAEELRDLAHGLAQALDQIHAVGVVHRDMKPGNVMLTDDGPVVIDFGISQVADDARLTRTGLVTGTPGYVDPGVLAGGVPGKAGDWWGWAAVLVFAVTGRAPFGTGQLQAVLARVESGRADVDGLPPGIAQALQQALQPDPALRMPPHAVLRALDDQAAGRDATVAVQVAPVQLPPSYAPGVPEGVMPTPVPVPAREPAPAPAEQEWPGWALPARSRPGITLVWWFAALGSGMLWPGWTLLLFAVVMIVGGAVGASAKATRNRRLARGPRRSDVAVASVSAPLHAVLSVAMFVPGALVGVLGGGILWGLAAPAVIGVSAFGTTVLVLAIMAVVTVLTWWTPSSNTAREGIWAVLDVAARGRMSTWVWLVVALAVAASTVAVAVLTTPEPLWLPLPVPPIPSFVS